MNSTKTLITRLLAALALVAAVLAVFVVLSSNTGGDDDSGKKDNRAAKSRQNSNKKPKQASYEVQGGDTLTGIAQKTGVSVERIESLNPELDPQALQAGQKLKLKN